MDLDLWGPPHQENPQETHNSLLPGSSSNVQDDDCGVDWIQADAENEIACKQVLMILIQKADVEIDELQKELVSLTNKLWWVENEEWFSICCNALQQKIHHLSLSLRSLRSQGEHMPSECFKFLKPAETISEFLRGLLRTYDGMDLQQNEQPVDICMKESNSYVPGQVTDPISSEKLNTSVLDTMEGDAAETTGVGESESDLSSMVQQQQQIMKKVVVGTSKAQSVVSKVKEGSKNKARKVVSGKKKREFDDGASSAEMMTKDASSSLNGEITECSRMTEVTVKDELVTPSSAPLDLSRCRLTELRVIAKKMKLKSVSKAKKPVLVQQIAKAMGNS